MVFRDGSTVDPEKVAAGTNTSKAAAKTAKSDAAAEGALATAKDAAATGDPATAEPATAKKPPKKKKPAKKKPRKAGAILPDAEVKTAADVFVPSKVLEPLPRPEGMTDDQEKSVNELLDNLKEGGGLAYIRAPGKLSEIGVTFIPLAANRMLKLDYTSVGDNQYAFALSEAIRKLTDFELGYDPARIVSEFNLVRGHANAKRTGEIYSMAKNYWHSDAGFAAYKKKYKKDKDQ
jgi:hypothetical protein